MISWNIPLSLQFLCSLKVFQRDSFFLFFCLILLQLRWGILLTFFFLSHSSFFFLFLFWHWNMCLVNFPSAYEFFIWMHYFHSIGTATSFLVCRSLGYSPVNLFWDLLPHRHVRKCISYPPISIYLFLCITQYYSQYLRKTSHSRSEGENCTIWHIPAF